MASDWTQLEVELIVADYVLMLQDELRGIHINKTHHRNALSKLLNGRSEGSIEFKHQNISAVLAKLGQPYIRGYKPRWNYQQLLENEVLKTLLINKAKLEPLFIAFSDKKIVWPIHHTDFDKVLDAPPDAQSYAAESKVSYKRRPIKINYLEREQRNISIGNQGEEFVVEFEKWRLNQAGKPALAKRIEWVSRDDDGAGFDILSKNIDGSDRYIEVKTTKLTKETPIFFSKNEYDFSCENSEKYYLYRLFNFSESPKMFELNGSFDSFCRKEPTNYKGFF